MWPAARRIRPAAPMLPASFVVRPPVPHDHQGSGAVVGAGARGRRCDCDHGADPQRVGAAGCLVPSAWRQGGVGAPRAVRRSARLLQQAHQNRPVGLTGLGAAAAAAPRATPAAGRPRPGRAAQAGGAPTLQPGQTPLGDVPAPGRAARAGGPGTGRRARDLRLRQGRAGRARTHRRRPACAQRLGRNA